MERCGLDLILFNRQGFIPKSCLALQLSVVGASLYCMDMYVLIMVRQVFGLLLFCICDARK